MWRCSLDKTDVTLIALWIHVPFVTAWIGLVMFDFFAARAPGLDMIQRARMITWSRPFVILSVILITATGIWQTIYNPFSVVTSYEVLERLRTTTTYGVALFWKHGFVLATFALTIFTRFVLGPRLISAISLETATGKAGASTAGASGDAHRLLIYIGWMAGLNLLACLGALLLTTRMVWELH